MGKFKRLLAAVALVMILGGHVSAALAADQATGVEPSVGSGALLTDLGAGRFAGPIGAGLVLIGGGLSIGKVACGAVESIARQPEAGGRIFTSMIITAAMIEGATLFGVVVCLLPAMK